MNDGTVLIVVAIIGLAGAWGQAIITSRRVKDTQHQVSTSNGRTIGELAESNHKKLESVEARLNDMENYQREVFLGVTSHLAEHVKEEQRRKP